MFKGLLGTLFRAPLSVAEWTSCPFRKNLSVLPDLEMATCDHVFSGMAPEVADMFAFVAPIPYEKTKNPDEFVESIQLQAVAVPGVQYAAIEVFSVCVFIQHWIVKSAAYA